MANLTKKYRLIWDFGTLNIQNDHTKNWAASETILANNGNLITFESDIYQDILDKIEENALHPIGEWVDYNEIPE